MKLKNDYTPEWINADDAAKWLGVTKATLWNWRQSKGLAFSNINGRNLMYDKKQLEEILFQNSTYAVA